MELFLLSFGESAGENRFVNKVVSLNMGFSLFFLLKLVSKQDTYLRMETKPEQEGIVRKVVWDWDSPYWRENNVEWRRWGKKHWEERAGCGNTNIPLHGNAEPGKAPFYPALLIPQEVPTWEAGSCWCTINFSPCKRQQIKITFLSSLPFFCH